MISNTITDVRIDELNRSIVLPIEVIDFADKHNIYIPHHLTLFANALYSRELVKMDYKKRLMSKKKFLLYLVDAIVLYKNAGCSPEEIMSITEDFTYDDFLSLFIENGHDVHWYRLSHRVV
ncbi:MAG: hypothetical protein J6K42_02650 [Clostridia bacterium]|nr:hypothetical protein [Clostridia bacterium]